MADTPQPSPGILPSAIRRLAQQLQDTIGASSPLADSLTKGEFREEEVVKAFRPHIARRYELAKGIVVNSAGEYSDPQDLVIHDSAVLPSLLGDGATRVFPVESVVGVVQVKSRATKASVESAVKNVASSKRLLPAVDRYGMPHGGVAQPGQWGTSASHFAGVLFLSSDTSVRTIVDSYADIVMSGDPRTRCDALCVVDQGSVLWGDPAKGRLGHLHFTARGEQAVAPLVIESEEDALLFFYLSLVEHLRNWISPPISWLDYVFGSDDGARNAIRFSYAYWYEDEENPPSWARE